MNGGLVISISYKIDLFILQNKYKYQYESYF